MLARQKVLWVAMVMCALACALPARAVASAAEESGLIDDNELVYASPAQAASRLQQIKALGVDRIKFSIEWNVVAPNPSSPHRPRFDATNPAAYPAHVWDRYDAVVRLAKELGFQVYLQLTPPAPLWALPANQPTNQGPSLGHAPKPAQFAEFVKAVGRRYSGSYVPPVPAGSPPASGSGSSSPSASPSTPPSTPEALPRVDYWGLWNEPNERSWLNPWFRKLPHRKPEMIQPVLYRGLVDAAWSALQATGHGADTILVGETANRGIVDPIPFVRALYCVSASSRPLRGRAASQVGCPTSSTRSGFVKQHPGLFDATGYAHHPYGFDVPPNRPYPDRTFVTLYNLPSFERLLDKIFAVYGKGRRGGVPLYMTEWGYKTNPPNPFVKTSQAQQAAWLDEGEYMTSKDPFVRMLTQFLLMDDAPNPLYPVGSPEYWGTFQTGLLNLDGTPKPSYAAYRLPIWLPVARHGHRVTVWGQLRPADHTKVQDGKIQYRRKGSQAWRTIRDVQTASREGFLVAHVALPAAGYVRLAWQAPGAGNVYYSRTVQVS